MTEKQKEKQRVHFTRFHVPQHHDNFPILSQYLYSPLRSPNARTSASNIISTSIIATIITITLTTKNSIQK